MTLAFDSPPPSPVPRTIRLAQGLACLSVAWAALHSARESTTPALNLEHTLFPASNTRAASASQAGMDALQAITAPGLASIEVIVQRNDTLDRIFRRLQISLADLAHIRALAGVRALLDRLSPGEHLKFLQRNGSLLGLTRNVSFTQQLEVRRRGEAFEATVLAQPVETQVSVARGVIDSSLFESANDAGLSDALVLKLARIFASDIDFVIGLRAGDEFTVEYERISQNGQHIKDGEILAARFLNQGHEYLAVRYVGPGGGAGYYSPDGRSVQKAFVRAPLEFQRISSGFSLARLHPILNTIRAHQGTDYAAPIGTPVHAAGSGRLSFRGVKGGYGNVIEIEHGNGIETVYGHLSGFAPLRSGARVQQGETIGYVGMTGLATGPHLHFEFHVNGRCVDPQQYQLPDAQPIDPSLRADFDNATSALLSALRGNGATDVVAR
jgi:murein DD-endopeptidase MepM/ murein hydrolase activator NlpD